MDTTQDRLPDIQTPCKTAHQVHLRCHLRILLINKIRLEHTSQSYRIFVQIYIYIYINASHMYIYTSPVNQCCNHSNVVLNLVPSARCRLEATLLSLERLARESFTQKILTAIPYVLTAHGVIGLHNHFPYEGL